MGQSSTEVEERQPIQNSVFGEILPYQLKDGIFGKIPCICSCVSSAVKLGEGINVKLVDPTDAESIQEYADLVKQDVCESFDPLNSSHMDAIGDNATTLARLLTVHYQGDNIEICTPKEEDRWGSWSSTATQIVAIGSVAAMFG